MSDNLNNSSNLFNRMSNDELEVYANKDDCSRLCRMAREILMYRRVEVRPSNLAHGPGTTKLWVYKHVTGQYRVERSEQIEPLSHENVLGPIEGSEVEIGRVYPDEVVNITGGSFPICYVKGD